MSHSAIRQRAVVILGLAAAWVAGSCASSEEEPRANPPAWRDAGPAKGGSAGTGSSGSSGTGTVGSGGGGGSSGGGGGGPGGGTGTCAPAFCPNYSMGTPCCVTPNGPCGFDNGTGCVGVGDPANDV